MGQAYLTSILVQHFSKRDNTLLIFTPQGEAYNIVEQVTEVNDNLIWGAIM